MQILLLPHTLLYSIVFLQLLLLFLINKCGTNGRYKGNNPYIQIIKYDIKYPLINFRYKKSLLNVGFQKSKIIQ